MTTLAGTPLEDLAFEAAIATAGDDVAVGEFVGQDVSTDGIVTVRFRCLLPGYRGWVWSVDLAVLDGEATVCESALLPGEDALRAPAWIPWSDRIRPGDLEPGMVLPYIADDPRVVPGYTETGDADRDAMAIFEFGLGRERVLAPEAREAAAERWYRGSHGPTAASAVASAAPCATCAFFVPMSGSLRMMFGACTNEWSPSDGRVVSVDHGCGAHSETEAERRASEWPAPEPIVDTDAVTTFDLLAAELDVETNPAPEPEPAVEAAEDDTASTGAVAEAHEDAAAAEPLAEDAAAAEPLAEDAAAEERPAD